MLKYISYLLLLIFLSINIYHYTISYEVIKLEKQNNSLKKEIFSELDKRDQLQTEWAIIVSPNNLERLAKKYSEKLKLRPISGDQITIIPQNIEEGE